MSRPVGRRWRGLLCLIPVLAAPLISAELAGVVRSGETAIPGAVVTATQGERTIRTATDSAGRFVFEGVPAGSWQMRVEIFGFEIGNLTGVEADREVVVELVMRPRTRSQTQAASGTARVENDPEPQPGSPGPGGVQLASSGSENVTESFLISGSVSQGLQGSDSGSMAVRGWGAALRRGATRRGRRVSATWNRSDSGLDARPYSISGQPAAKPDYSTDRVTLSLGGPLRIPRLAPGRGHNYSVSYEARRGRDPFSAFATVPGVRERAGDFSQSFTRGPVAIFDPQGSAPFPGAVIPQQRIRPASTGLLDFIPLPNQPGALQNYQLASRTSRTGDSVRGTLNLRLGSKDQLSVAPQYLRNASGQLQNFGYLDESDSETYSSTITWTRTVSPNSSFAAWWAWTDTHSETTPFFAYKENVAGRLGIAGTSQSPINYGPPNVDFTNFGGLRDASADSRKDWSSVFGLGYYRYGGPHSLTIGADVTLIRLDVVADENARGTYFFSGLATSRLTAEGLPVDSTGFDFADFLLGRPQSASIRFGSPDNGYRSLFYDVHVTDDWQVRENLSLSLGVRYEFSAPFTETRGRIANLDVASGFANVAVVSPGQPGPFSGRFPEALIDADRNDISPRFGFAWRPFRKGKLNLRGGYGIYYNGAIYSRAVQRLASQPPFANAGTVSTTAAAPLQIEQGFTAVSASPRDVIRNTYAVDRRYRTGYAQIWNFAVSKDLPHAILLEAGYLASKGTRLDIQRAPNRAAPGSPLSSEDRRAIGNAQGFIYDSSDGNSILHAGQFRFVRRFQKGVALNAFYSFSKSIDNASTFGGGVGVVAQDDTNLRAERGLTSFDERHSLNVNWTLLSPVGGQGAPLRLGRAWQRLFGNWVVLGGLRVRSGGWLTARTLGNRSDAGGTGVVGSSRADATGQPVTGGAAFFNLGAFAVPAANRFGNASRNTIPTPRTLTINASLGRTFFLGESRSLEFRLDSSNTGNFVNVTRFGTVVNASTYGVMTGVQGMRTMSTTMRLRF